ncbi:MAG: radical SAM protein [Candidatus Saganbacteria bacterium]|nr:radical SAM protein [Candidatus Saganbacteria bacterium]
MNKTSILPKIIPASYESRHIFSRRHSARIAALANSGMDVGKLAKIPPIFMTADLTWRCNYKCVGCVDSNVAFRRDEISMPWNIASDLLDYASRFGIEGFMIMGGEVPLYEYFDDFCMHAAKLGIAISLVSNGSTLDKHIDALVAVQQVAGSSIRVSMNQYGDKYIKHTNGDVPFQKLIDNFSLLSSRGIRILVSTVIFCRSAEERIHTQNNVFDIAPLASALKQAGVASHLLIPARDPASKSMFPLSGEEEAEIARVTGSDWSPMKLGKAGVFENIGHVPRQFTVCPSSLLKVLVGANGTLYSCTDYRGVNQAVIGQLDDSHTFERVWHSVDRVRRQMAFTSLYMCRDHTCLRENANNLLDDLMAGRIKMEDIELTQSVDPFF